VLEDPNGTLKILATSLANSGYEEPEKIRSLQFSTSASPLPRMKVNIYNLSKYSTAYANAGQS
jgi:hypothetical protein